VVGGAVRNALMGLPVTDTDLATSWAPEQVVARAEQAGIRAVPTGIDHGTVTLVIDGQRFRDYHAPPRCRDRWQESQGGVSGSDWQIDAERRDFTINALYAGQDGSVIDLVGGLEDIASRTVRFIGDADARIAEDYLRVLRYFRFFAHYGAGRPDAAALKACAGRARSSKHCRRNGSGKNSRRCSRLRIRAGRCCGCASPEFCPRCCQRARNGGSIRSVR
jgi:poly(A) polymerase